MVEVTHAGVYGKHSVSKGAQWLKLLMLVYMVNTVYLKGHCSTVVEVTPAGVYGKHSVSKGAQWLKLLMLVYMVILIMEHTLEESEM